MDWSLWILASAVFLAFYDLAKKASVRDNAVLSVLLCATACGAAAYAAGVVLCGDARAMFACAPRTYLLSAAKAVIVAASWIFTFTALRTLPVTIATPIRASAPALVFVAAFYLYGEVPGLLQAAGMLLVFAGYFAFSWAGRHEGIDFFRSRAVWCAFAGAFLSACSGLFDKYVFQVAAQPVEPVQFWFQVFLVACYALVFGAQRLLRLPRARFVWRRTIPAVGVLLVFADWLYFHGLARPGVPISVASLMRRVSVVITFALGARLFHETNLRRKVLALAAILSGVALLCLA